VLQLALAYAALANGGTLYQPQVVRSIETSDGTVVQEFPPRVRRVLALDSDHLTLVKSALAGVVNDRKGTAHGAAIPGVDAAGKTGTAQVAVERRGMPEAEFLWRKTDHAWFAGYSPIGSPEIAVVALIEHGGGGGKVAAPIAMKVIHDWQALKEKRLSSALPASDKGKATP
jgi:penicillin-binding protein 2